jgi:hypothetical protein
VGVTKPLRLSRDRILGHRRRVSALDVRMPAGSASLEKAASCGLQDSMPRAALLSLHARVEGVAPDSWDDPALIQVWGPRWAVYVVPRRDVALFTVSRYPEDLRGRAVAEEMAAGIKATIGRRRVKHDEAAAFVSGDSNRIKYATATGTLAIRWEGARQADVWLMPRPKVSAPEARREVARRHLHVFGPTTATGFARWLGVDPAQGRATYAELAAAKEIVAVSTPMGDEFILASDETSLRRQPGSPAAARLLPSGDTFTLMKGADRELLVPDALNRERLWTPRVWPGALLVEGEVAGTWRRDQHKVTISAWRRLSVAELHAVESEAMSLPLPALTKPIAVTWEN